MDEPLTSRRAAERIRELCKGRNLSAQQLADLCVPHCPSLTRSTIAKIESGSRTKLTIEELQTLAHVLGVDAVTLTASHVHVALNNDAAAALSKLHQRTGSNTADLLSRAILLLEFMDALQRANDQLSIQRPDGTNYIVHFL